MDRYVGKVCPYCKTVLKEDDDIVVCSQCDMPHHKDCWIENQGCTTFGCLGTIQSPGGSGVAAAAANANPYTAQSPYANPVPVTAPYSAGQQVIQPQFAPKTQAISPGWTYVTPSAYAPLDASGMAKDEEDSYIQTKLEYYKAKFAQMRRTGSKGSWNWSAFLAGPLWFIYRRMYGWGFALLGLEFVLSRMQNAYLILFQLGVTIVVGAMGNSLYMAQIDRCVNEGKYLHASQKSLHVDKNGGVNSTAVILAILGYWALLTLFSGI